ncbi:MAG TPA: penicillin acylase family protein, partial [Candidatus Thermoplasmatota archaeon]|nr:penicillin acylase family protein [Candidatus Thermoplasmatota archaeon]
VVEQRICRLQDNSPVLYRTPDGLYAFASQRSYRGDEVRSGTLWLQIGTIDDLADFETLFADFAFTFNFNFATEGGQIAYYHVGRQPQRDDRLDPRLPRPAWDSTYDWDPVFLHLADLPHVIDPASGYTVNWNNKADGNWSSGDSRELWGSIHRAEIMEEILLARIAAAPGGKLTLDDLREVNERASTHEPYADDFYPLLYAAASAAGNTAATSALYAWMGSGFDYADRTGGPDDTPDGSHDFAAFRLYEKWMSAFMDGVFRDDIGDFTRAPRWNPGSGGADPHAADHGEHGQPFNVLLDAANGTTARAWCDDGTTDAVETCADIASAAFAVAVADGTWDDAFPMRQSTFTALGAGNAYKIPMTNRPSFQHFYDWGLPEGDARSRNVVPPGVSGHMNVEDFFGMQWKTQAAANGFPPPPGPLAPPSHLDDQLQLYKDFGDKPLLHDAATLLQQHTESVTVIG